MLKKQQVLIYQIFPRKQNLKSNIHKLDIDELKAVPDQLNNLKSKLNDTNVDKRKAIQLTLKNFRFCS